MNVFSVIHRDDTNDDIKLVGTFRMREDAVKKLQEEVSRIVSSGIVVNGVRRYGDYEVAIDYDESYVDILKIEESEVK